MKYNPKPDIMQDVIKITEMAASQPIKDIIAIQPDRDSRVKLAKTIKKYRIRKPMSQSELSEKSGISITTISRIERGVIIPETETLSKLIEALTNTKDNTKG